MTAECLYTTAGVCLLLLLLSNKCQGQDFKPTPLHVTVVVGETLTLPCGLVNRTMTSPTDGHYATVWYPKLPDDTQGPSYFPLTSFLDGRGNLSLDGTLTVLNVTKTDFQSPLVCSILDSSTITTGKVWNFPSNITVIDASAASPTTAATTPTTTPVVATTAPIQGPPDQPPQNVQFTVLNSTAINVTWEAANVSMPQFRATLYSVSVWKQKRSVLVALITLSAGTHHHQVVNNLHPNNVYSVSVLAKNSNGFTPSTGLSFTLRADGSATTAPPASSVLPIAISTTLAIVTSRSNTRGVAGGDSGLPVSGLSKTMVAVIASIGSGIGVCLLVALTFYFQASKKKSHGSHKSPVPCTRGNSTRTCQDVVYDDAATTLDILRYGLSNVLASPVARLRGTASMPIYEDDVELGHGTDALCRNSTMDSMVVGPACFPSVPTLGMLPAGCVEYSDLSTPAPNSILSYEDTSVSTAGHLTPSAGFLALATGGESYNHLSAIHSISSSPDKANERSANYSDGDHFPQVNVDDDSLMNWSINQNYVASLPDRADGRSTNCSDGGHFHQGSTDSESLMNWSRNLIYRRGTLGAASSPSAGHLTPVGRQESYDQIRVHSILSAHNSEGGQSATSAGPASSACRLSVDDDIQALTLAVQSKFPRRSTHLNSLSFEMQSYASMDRLQQHSEQDSPAANQETGVQKESYEVLDRVQDMPAADQGAQLTGYKNLPRAAHPIQTDNLAEVAVYSGVSGRATGTGDNEPRYA